MLAETLGMTMNMTTNTVALVTGASSGIGRETAQLLAEHDARTFGTVRDLRRASLIDQVELIEMDVKDDGSVREAVRSVLEKAGKIDVLINNAGYSLAGGLEETSVEEARQLFETNFFGVLRVTQAVLPSMLSAPILLSGKKATVWVSAGTADTIWSVIDAGAEILPCA
jgi:NADP-dependent 3-hydroxy acid dehydrogenase YdfG